MSEYPGPVRIFIGTEPKVRVAELVLRYSILKHASLPVEFTALDDTWQIPHGIRQGTGFSLRRWMIPERCEFTGRAIYLDADMLVLSDVAELWRMPEEIPSDTATVWCAYQPDKHYPKGGMQSSCMVIECARASYWRTKDFWDWFRAGKVHYPKFMHGDPWLKEQPIDIGTEWNDFNRYRPGVTKLLHYTREAHQPWYRPEHAFRQLWEEHLVEAIRAGAVPFKEFEHAISRFGKPDPSDRRRTYGIHPHFRKHLNVYKELADAGKHARAKDQG